MANVLKVAFKALTRNDFYRINSGGLEHGGGQAYIDFRRSDVSVDEWEESFCLRLGGRLRHLRIVHRRF